MKNTRYLFYFLFFLLISSCAEKPTTLNEKNRSLFFQSEGGNSLEIVIPDREIYSYENIKLTFKFLYNKKMSPMLPDWTDLEDSLNIIAVRNLSGPIEENEKISREQELTIGALLPGDYLINPITISFFSDDQLVDEINTDYIPLNISSSLIEGEEDILDDFDIIASNKINFTILMSLIIILFLISTCLIYLFHKKRKRTSLSGESENKNYIELINKIESADVKVLYQKLNNILKEFLENKMFLSIQSQTTEEFIIYSKITPILEDWLKKQLFDFLKRSDEIRFGERIPDQERIRGDIQFCNDFIDYVNKKVINEVSL